MLSKNRAHVDVFDGKNITLPIQIEKAVISLTILMPVFQMYKYIFADSDFYMQ